MDLAHLNKIAIKAALAAGKVIQKYMNEEVKVEKKEGGATYSSKVVTAADIESERAILAHILPTCDEFDIGLLTEETEEDGSRLEKDFFWCIDPMDGTLSFIKGHAGFAVSIALVSKDGTPQLGVVYDPSTDTLYHATKNKGAFKNKRPWIIKHRNKHLTYVTDKTLKDTPHADKIEILLQKQITKLSLDGITEIAGAGSVMNGILVLENGPACMLKLPKKEKGGGCIWDFAAIACIFHELGLPATNFEGGRLKLNRKDGTFMNQEGVFFGNLI